MRGSCTLSSLHGTNSKLRVIEVCRILLNCFVNKQQPCGCYDLEHMVKEVTRVSTAASGDSRLMHVVLMLVICQY